MTTTRAENPARKSRPHTAGPAEKKSGLEDPRSQGLRRLIAQHGFHFQEFLEAVFAPFAARARLLVAAERRVEVGAGAVQVDVAGAQARATLRACSTLPDWT